MVQLEFAQFSNKNILCSYIVARREKWSINVVVVFLLKIDRYSVDPLIYKGRLKAGWMHAFRLGVAQINKGLPSVKWPFLCIQGGIDPWIPATEIQRVMEMAASPDKTIVVRSRKFNTRVALKLWTPPWHFQHWTK